MTFEETARGGLPTKRVRWEDDRPPRRGQMETEDDTMTRILIQLHTMPGGTPVWLASYGPRGVDGTADPGRAKRFSTIYFAEQVAAILRSDGLPDAQVVTIPDPVPDFAAA